MSETLTFVCSICAEAATDICVYCTKDACPNHRCAKCLRCSDCCECDLANHRRQASAQPVWKNRPENERQQVPGDQGGKEHVDLPE